jgi:hypothetical protein
MVREEKQYVRRTGVVARRVAGEMLLVPVAPRAVNEGGRAAELYVLNATGFYLWEALADPRTPRELARKLIGEFEVSEESANADVAAFLTALGELGMVEVMDRGENASR